MVIQIANALEALTGQVALRDPYWNPRPHPDSASVSRRAYFAGYSDGYHGAHFGAGDDGSIGGFSDYRPGFSDGRADAARAKAERGEG